jgi:hypothetical protein
VRVTFREKLELLGIGPANLGKDRMSRSISRGLFRIVWVHLGIVRKRFSLARFHCSVWRALLHKGRGPGHVLDPFDALDEAA